MEIVLLFLIVLLISFISTLLSSMSGGGSSIISVPVWLSLGFSFPLATAIQQICSAFWVLPASRNYLKSFRVDWKFLILFTAIGLVGVIGGVLLLLSVPQRFMEILIGSIIIALVVFTFFKKDFGVAKQKIKSKIKRALIYPFALTMGFYESIFGSGNGIFFSTVSIYSRGFVLKEALGYYYAIAFPWVLLSAILLISKGYWNIPVMIAGIVGSTFGGYIGSKYAAYKGNKFIKMIFCIVGFVLGMKLLLGI